LANHKSALKRIKQNEKRRMRNRIVKSKLKTSVKNALGAAQGQGDAASELRSAQSVIDKAARKGVIHRRTAARKISRLHRRVSGSAS
jgi:small subunit ribosomal protein S20